MDRKQELQYIVKEIQELLYDLESTFWDVYVKPAYEYDLNDNKKGNSIDFREDDNKTWLFHGTRRLYYKICLFLELKSIPLYYQMFTAKFGPIIDNEKKVTKQRGPLYSELEPSMIIHDEFRDFLSVFSEFDYSHSKKQNTNKLKLILENTNSIISYTKTKVTNETSIYKPVKWIVEMIYPTTRSLGKARFIKKFKTYHPDILVPEISSAVEYKLVRSGENIEKYLDQIKTDADNYEGDSEYKFFIAVVYFEEKAELNPTAFKQSVNEKSFPDNWTIIAL